MKFIIFRFVLVGFIGLWCCLSVGTGEAGLKEKRESDGEAAGDEEVETDEDEATERIEHVVREIEGWKVRVDERLLKGEHAKLGRKGLRILENQLHWIGLVIPKDRLVRLREVPIFLDLDHPLGNLQYHPSEKWLKEHGYSEKLVQAVHIPKVKRLIDISREYAQPWAMLHELAHAYHDRVLGFDYGPIRQGYDQAKVSGRYESVLHISGKERRHYALTNHKEYFAEMTECYFGTNDFYPFVRGELSKCDPRTYQLLERIWRKPRDSEESSSSE